CARCGGWLLRYFDVW
nr:immunoglobulin heavy chain junction region [Mus musculus]